MKKFVQFFSFAAMTQVILLLNQVVLLPMQIRLWGNKETALWYAAIALATATTVADLGLRTAGHVELLRLVRSKDPAAEEEFAQLWTWIRLLVVLVTATLLIGDIVYRLWHGTGNAFGHGWALGRALLTLAYAFETVLIVRIVYLDSLGEYSRAESSYFAFGAMRLGLAIPAMLIFKIHSMGLCWLFFATSVLGLILQGWLCKIPPQLRLFSRVPRRLSLRTCFQARYTLAEPCANWVRISLPVLVISTIGFPTTVTTYVALRAIYGAGRTTIQQVARVASVEVLRFRNTGRAVTGESLLAFFLMLTAFIGTAMACLVSLDNLRLLSLWLKHFDRHLFQNINLAFALTGSFYSYQVLVALSFRVGQLATMARRQYAYVCYSAAFAGVALIVKSLTVYLVLLVIAEIALSISFMAQQNIGGVMGYKTKAGWRGLGGSFAGALLVLTLWMSVRHANTDFFLQNSVATALQTACLLAVGLGFLLLLEVTANAGILRNLRTTIRQPATTVQVS
jgi:hypothetical protein